MVEYQDMERAQIFVEKCKQWFKEMLDLRAKYAETSEEEKRKQWRAKIIAIVSDEKNQSQNRWVTKTTIRKHIAIKIMDLYEVMRALEDFGAIEDAPVEVLESWKGRGPKPDRAWRLKQ